MDESYQMEWRQSSLRHRKRRRAWRREHRAPGRRRMWTTLYIEIGLMHGHDGPWTISTTEGVLARLRDIRYFQHTHAHTESVSTSNPIWLSVYRISPLSHSSRQDQFIMSSRETGQRKTHPIFDVCCVYTYTKNEREMMDDDVGLLVSSSFYFCFRTCGGT